MDAIQKTPPTAQRKKTRNIFVRLTDEQRAMFVAAAAQENRKLSNFIINACIERIREKLN